MDGLLESRLALEWTGQFCGLGHFRHQAPEKNTRQLRARASPPSVGLTRQLHARGHPSSKSRRSILGCAQVSEPAPNQQRAMGKRGFHRAPALDCGVRDRCQFFLNCTHFFSCLFCKNCYVGNMKFLHSSEVSATSNSRREWSMRTASGCSLRICSSVQW